MRTRNVTLSVATLLLLTLGCKRKTSTTSAPPVPPPIPVVSDGSTPPAAASVYDAGTAADRKATEKDRLFKRWAAAFVRGTPADKGKARAELAGQPPELRAEFEKFC
jgi:hypothetical protein